MSDDLIKRSDAIKAMEQRYQDILRIFKRKVKDGEKAIALDMIGCVKSLPSADIPQGEWHNGFYDFLWNVINPNEMQKYIEMYEAQPIAVDGAQMKGEGDE